MTSAVRDQWAARSAIGQVKATREAATAPAKIRFCLPVHGMARALLRCRRRWPTTTSATQPVISPQVIRWGSNA